MFSRPEYAVGKNFATFFLKFIFPVLSWYKMNEKKKGRKEEGGGGTLICKTYGLLVGQQGMKKRQTPRQKSYDGWDVCSDGDIPNVERTMKLRTLIPYF